MANVRRYGLLGDVPVGDHHVSRGEANRDGLDRQAFATVLAMAAVQTTDTLTVGVYGDWGEGKTSLMRLMKDVVDGQKTAIGVWFNAWQYEREEHLIVPLIATAARDIAEAVGEREGVAAKLTGKIAEGANKLHQALRAVAYGFSFKGKSEIPLLGGAEVNFSGKDMIDRYQALINDVTLEKSLYFDAFERLRGFSEKEGKAVDAPKIVVFIDDLDRCLPDAAVRLLENIKLVLSIPNFSFVLGIAPKVIQKFVERKFSKKLGLDEAYFRNYLDKFVQVPVHLPPKGDEQFETYVKQLVDAKDVLTGEEIAAFTNLSGLIAAISNHNPRSAVRFVNQILVLNRISIEQKSPVGVADLAFASALNDCRKAFLSGKIDFGRLIAALIPQREEVVGREGDDAEALATMGWKTPLHPEMEFGPGLAVVIEDGNPAVDPIAFALRLRRLSKIQSQVGYLEAADALNWLAQNIHVCQALQEARGLKWLRSKESIEGSFSLTATVQTEAPAPTSEPDWESIRKRVCEKREDPLECSEILAQIERGGTVPDFARPYVTDLTPLQRLNQLTTLDLEGCTGVTDLAPLQRLNRLKELSLAGCRGVTDLTPLKHLNQLTALYLEGCTGVTDLTPLKHLNQLTGVHLVDCTGVTDLVPLQHLNQLTWLDLSGCAGVTDLAPLQHLKELTILSLNGCTGVADLAPIQRLNQLTTLYLVGCTGVTDLRLLRELTALDVLTTPDCKRFHGGRLKAFLAKP